MREGADFSRDPIPFPWDPASLIPIVSGSAGSVSHDVRVQRGSLPGSLFYLRGFCLLNMPGSGGAKSPEAVQSAGELTVESHFVFIQVNFGFAESGRAGRPGFLREAGAFHAQMRNRRQWATAIL